MIASIQICKRLVHKGEIGSSPMNIAGIRTRQKVNGSSHSNGNKVQYCGKLSKAMNKEAWDQTACGSCKIFVFLILSALSTQNYR